MVVYGMLEFRVQIGFYKRAPYFQRADLKIGDRLARVVSKEGRIWHLEDDHGQRHAIEVSDNEEPGKNSDEGRWVILSPMPTYWIGEELTLSWRRRNCANPSEQRSDVAAVVIAEDAESITVSGPDESLHRILRANGHEFERTSNGKQCSIRRDEARWVIVGRQSTL